MQETKRHKRSAIKAEATTGRMDITDNDRNGFFEPLTRYGFLPTRDLKAFDPRYHSRSAERLTYWFGEAAEWPRSDKPIIRHTPALRYSINAQNQYRRGPAVYRALNKDKDFQRLAEATIIGPYFDDHDIGLSHAVAEIELSCRKHGLRFINHLEILENAPLHARDAAEPLCIPVQKISWIFEGPETLTVKTSVTPDAIFGIEYPEGVRFFAFEYDRGNETNIPVKPDLKKTTWLKKWLCYDYLAKGALEEYLGIPKMTVLALMKSNATAKHILQDFKDIHKSFSPKFVNGFVVGVAKPVGRYSMIPPPDDYLFNLEWDGVGDLPLKLSQL